MIEVKIDKGVIEGLRCSGTPEVILAEIAEMIVIILESVGDDKVKKICLKHLEKHGTIKTARYIRLCSRKIMRTKTR